MRFYLHKLSRSDVDEREPARVLTRELTREPMQCLSGQLHHSTLAKWCRSN